MFRCSALLGFGTASAIYSNMFGVLPCDRMQRFTLGQFRDPGFDFDPSYLCATLLRSALSMAQNRSSPRLPQFQVIGRYARTRGRASPRTHDVVISALLRASSLTVFSTRDFDARVHRRTGRSEDSFTRAAHRERKSEETQPHRPRRLRRWWVASEIELQQSTSPVIQVAKKNTREIVSMVRCTQRFCGGDVEDCRSAARRNELHLLANASDGRSGDDCESVPPKMSFESVDVEVGDRDTSWICVDPGGAD